MNTHPESQAASDGTEAASPDTAPPETAPVDTTPELEAVADEVLDFDDGDIPMSEPVATVQIELTGGVKRRVHVRRLTAAEAIKLLRDAAKPDAEKMHGVPVMKLTRCVVNPKNPTHARFSHAKALELIENGDANLLKELLRAIHLVNPLIKNA